MVNLTLEVTKSNDYEWNTICARLFAIYDSNMGKLKGLGMISYDMM